MSLQILMTYFFIFPFLFGAMSSDIDQNRSLPDFIPTNEWQIVQPGQAIPKGIHVRHNFETGLTEAKLMNVEHVNASDHSSIILSINQNQILNKNNPAKSRKLNVSFDRNIEFRSVKELKDVYEKLHESVKSDSEIMNNLFTQYSTSDDQDKKIMLLYDLSDFLRQFDNAVNFAKNGWLTTLVEDLHSAPIKQKKAILSCLSSAMQSNIAVKIRLLEDGLLNQIYRIWKNQLSSFENQPEMELLSKCLLAVTNMLYNFPTSQMLFFGPRSDNSIPVGFDLFKRTWNFHLKSCLLQECKKLKVQIISLLGGLLDEQHQTSQDNDKKLKQYAEIDFIGELRRQGWCKEITNFLIDRDIDSPILTDHVSREKALQVGLHFVEICNSDELFPTDDPSLKELLNAQLTVWHEEYTRLAIAELKDVGNEVVYFSLVKNLLERLQHNLSFPAKIHTEI